MTAPRPAATRALRRHLAGGSARVGLFSGALAVVAVLLLATVVPHDAHPGGGQLLLALGLMLGFAVAEAVVLHVEVGEDSASTASLTELPLALGLLWLDPLLLVAVRVLGLLLGLVYARGQSGGKLAFNAASSALEAVLAVLVVQAFSGLPDTLLVRWVAVVLACLAAGTFSSVSVLAAISLDAGRSQFRGLNVVHRDSAALGLVAGTVGLVAAELLDRDRTAALPVLLVTAALVWSYRDHAALRRRHERLSSLYGFVRDVSTGAADGGTVGAVLSQTLELLRGEVAVLSQVQAGSGSGLHLLVHRMGTDGVLHSERHVAGPGDWPVARCLSSGQPLLAPRGTRDPAAASYLAQEGVRDAVLVAVPATEGPGGADSPVAGPSATLMVGSRRSDYATFEPADVVALQGVAHHAAVALQNGRLVDRLTYESRHDALTALPNRTEFLDRLSDVLAHDTGSGTGEAPERRTTVLLMDLDRFKDVNDTLGHAAGDRVLCEVAERLAAGVDPAATVARLGGDEFAVVLPGRGVPDGLALAARLRTVLERPAEIDGLFVDVGVSIGVATAPEHGTSASLLMRRADIAMYDAKAGSGLASYDPQRDDSSTSRLALVAQLRAALDDGQFHLDYQPQVDGEGVPHGFEALIRWHHPQRGLVQPDDFIPVAERAGLLQDLTGWVLRTALDAAVSWRDAGHDLGIAVNLSPRNLLDPGLPSTVRRELAARGLPPHRLTLEITEGTIMAEPARAVETLHQLRATGVRLSVDDFGTGYSSLAYLRELPVDEVKVDKSFVRGLATDEDDVAIVRTVLALAASLRLEVVAEGVEDEASRRLLAGMGCGLLQGFHLSRPMPSAAVLPWLATQDRRSSVERRAPHARRTRPLPGPRRSR